MIYSLSIRESIDAIELITALRLLVRNTDNVHYTIAGRTYLFHDIPDYELIVLKLKYPNACKLAFIEEDIL